MDKIEIFFVNNYVFSKNSRCFILLRNRLYGQTKNSLSTTYYGRDCVYKKRLALNPPYIIDFYIVVLLIICLMSSAFICDTLCIVFFTQILFN